MGNIEPPAAAFPLRACEPRKPVAMTYRITRHPEQLLWVVVDGHLSLHHAECYLRELWELLDASAHPQDLLVDGRRIAGAAPGARRRTEQIVHHPNLGHLAFVVGDLHLLLLAPLMKLVSGVGLFGDEHAALAYLRAARAQPTVDGVSMPNLATPASDAPPEVPAPSATPPLGVVMSKRFVGDQHPRLRPLPPPLTARYKDTPHYPPHTEYSHAGTGDEEP